MCAGLLHMELKLKLQMPFLALGCALRGPGLTPAGKAHARFSYLELLTRTRSRKNVTFHLTKNNQLDLPYNRSYIANSSDSWEIVIIAKILNLRCIFSLD